MVKSIIFSFGICFGDSIVPTLIHNLPPFKRLGPDFDDCGLSTALDWHLQTGGGRRTKALACALSYLAGLVMDLSCRGTAIESRRKPQGPPGINGKEIKSKPGEEKHASRTFLS